MAACSSHASWRSAVAIRMRHVDGGGAVNDSSATASLPSLMRVPPASSQHSHIASRSSSKKAALPRFAHIGCGRGFRQPFLSPSPTLPFAPPLVPGGLGACLPPRGGPHTMAAFLGGSVGGSASAPSSHGSHGTHASSTSTVEVEAVAGGEAVAVLSPVARGPSPPEVMCSCGRTTFSRKKMKPPAPMHMNMTVLVCHPHSVS